MPSILQEKIFNDIINTGRSIMMVFPTENDPIEPYAYTIGNAINNLPELLFIGSCDTGIGMMLNLYSEMLEKGHVFEDGDLIDIGGRFPCMAVHVTDQRATAVDDWMIQAKYFYDADPELMNNFKVIQILMPDLNGRFGKEADEKYRKLPILGKIPRQCN